MHGSDDSRVAVFRALGAGGVGGGIAAFFELPLAWMMGALAANAVLSGCGVRVRIPQNLRRMVLAVAGVYIGAGVAPDLAERLAATPVSLSLLALYVAAATAGGAFAFRKLLGTNRTTAWCASAPGGLSVAVAMAENRGDDRVIAVMHMLRAALVVVAIPLMAGATGLIGTAEVLHPDEVRHGAFKEWAAVYVAGRGWMGVNVDLALDLVGLAEVAGITLAALVFGLVLRAKAPVYLLSAAGLAAAARLLEWTSTRPPEWPLSVAMVALGAAVGSGFHLIRGSGAGRTLGILGVSGAVVAAMLGLSAGFAWVGAEVLGMPFPVVLLFFTPGGVAEISLIAVALGADPPMVAFHQMMRLLLILGCAPALIALAARRDGGS